MTNDLPQARLGRRLMGGRNEESSATSFHTGHVKLTHIHEMPGNSCCRGHYRADQVRPAFAPLPPLEVAIRGAGTSLVRRQHVGVHSNTHAAARVTPLNPRLGENLVESCLLRQRLDAPRA